MKIYGYGYSGKGGVKAIQEHAEANDCLVVDVRMSPNSPNPMYRKGDLQRVLGDRYIHIREFGNKAYRTKGEIQIADFSGGEDRLLRVLQGSPHENAMLMCGCADAEGCHRTVVLNLLQEAGWDVGGQLGEAEASQEPML